MKTICINRHDRKDRWNKALLEFDKIECNAERFDAIIKSPGWQGCRDSHLAILEQNKTEQTFMVLEDDVAFMPDARKNLDRAILELPYYWDILYLGCNPLEKLEQYSDHLYYLKKSYTTHAIIFNNPGMIDFILSQIGKIRKIDVFYSDVIFEKYNCFVTYPLVAAQHNGVSNICKGTTNYFNTITNNFKKFTR